MKKPVSYIFFTLFFILFSNLVFAESVARMHPKKVAEDIPRKLGLDYFTLDTNYLDFRAIPTAGTANILGTSLVMGTYLTNWVKVETRIGKGLKETTITNTLKAGINYWASWYMGVIYPITGFSIAYIQGGFSYVKGYTSRTADDTSPIPSSFVSSPFSISWLAGVDVHVLGNWHITGEMGRLHEDTTTGIKTFTANLGVKYEY